MNMRWYFTILNGLMLFLIFSQAAGQDNKSGARDEAFRKGELMRYQSGLQRRTADIAAEDRIDVKYYKLDIKITTTPQYLRGTVLMKAVSRQNNLGSITLDLMNAMTVDSVRVGGTKTTAVQHASDFDITLDRIYNSGELMTVEVFYRGKPGSSGFGSFTFASHQSTPWVWSLSEPYGAKDWWPCKDHPADKADSVDIFITCDSAYRVGSNGKLVSATYNGNGTVTYFWQERYPIATYLVSVAITNYAQFTNWFKYSPTDSMPVLNYVLPEDLSYAQAYLPYTIGMLRIYSNLFGLYPFVNEKYGHSEFGWGGGMEHQTMTSLTSFGEGLVAHELAHQWFGDMITCRTWPDIWLNEGFATYCEALYQEGQYGTAAYLNDMYYIMSGARSAVGTIHVQDTSNVGTLFDGYLVYDKGATVLHMLRHVLGDTMFFHAMHAYAGNPALRYGTASTDDFKAACEAVSGKTLDYFFNEWIYGENYPHYAYGLSSRAAASGYTVDIQLVQASGPVNPPFFTMPVDLKLLAADWDTTVTVFNDSLAQVFTFNLSHNPTAMEVDPDNWILKTVVRLDSSMIFSADRPFFNFGYVLLGSQKKDSVTVSNPGFTTLEISSVVSDTGAFTVTPTSASIPASMRQKFYIIFSPIKTGVIVGHIVFTHNGATSPNKISVGGIGILPTYPFSVSKSWNMASVPLTAPDMRKIALFPTAVSAAFSFGGDTGYAVSDTLRNGAGYWLKFDHAQSVSLSGFRRSEDTVDVKAGWNMIGSISDTVPVSLVKTVPAGALSSEFIGYNGGYTAAQKIEPLKGYWVKATSPAKIIISSAGEGNFQFAPAIEELSGLSTLKISDREGNTQVLYFGKKPEGSGRVPALEMPPAAPEGAFDARFASGKMLEYLDIDSEASHEILISGSAVYPVMLFWDLKSPLRKCALAAGESTYPLENSGSARLTASRERVFIKTLGRTSLPAVYSLDQNSPNPFNPVTTIRYSLPLDSRIILKVFDMLGQEIKTLADGVREAGFGSVDWNGTDESGNPVTSGVYFCRLEASSVSGQAGVFVQTRKLLMVK